jgi:lipid II:glycine glycyltransferase (peptidoglycan interpeptide bridge formation enzyme)
MDNRNRKAIIPLTQDIYYQREYLELYLKKDDTIFEFKYIENDNLFYSISIKRPINKIGEKKISDNYFDLETAYGYGGIYCNTSDQKFIEIAKNKYIEKCLNENIIAEFSRIHPFNHSCFNIKDFYDLLIKDRLTVSVDCTLSKEERWSTYPSKIRTILRKCEKELIFEKTNDINSFMKLYDMTMSKNNASDFYYFDEQYFNNLLAIDNVDLYVVRQNNNIIAASFFMFGETIGHYHLSANDYEYRKFNGNYFILDSIFDVAREKNMTYFHLGGGRTNVDDDLLLKFKSKFSTIRKDFYLGGKVFNQKKFTEYNDLWKKQNETDLSYFLKYRLP